MKTLYVFDVDQTLFHTDAKIAVYLNGKFEGHLRGAHEYHKHVANKKEGHTYDFLEYISASIFKEQAKPIQHILEAAKDAIADPDGKVIILTARNTMDNMDLFKEVFEEHGLDTKKLEFEFGGDARDIYGRSSMSSSQAKKYIIDSYLCTYRYGRVVVYDDLAENVDLILSLRYDYPTFKFESYIVG